MRTPTFFYMVLLFSLVVYSYGFVDPNLRLSTSVLYQKFHQPLFELIFHKRLFSTIAFIVILFSFFFFYYFFLRLVANKKFTTENIKWLIGVTVGILALSYPAFSYDIFNYIFTAKVTFFYHENPYIIMPVEFIEDPNLVFTRAANKIALYGPLWVLLSSFPYVISFGNIILSIFSFKALVAIFYLATAWSIWKTSQNNFSVALFALNPLVIIETLVSGHNDIVMMFFALLSFYLLKKDRIFVALFALLTSILIKYATILLLPIFLFIAYRTWKKRVVNWDLVYMVAAIVMFFVFLTAPLREEIYPWYVIWILSFAALIPRRKFLLVFVMVLSFAVLLRYVPVLYTGSYKGATPLLKEIVTFVPLGIVSIFWLCRRLFWQRFSR